MESLKGKTVLVTGAGGSIGSEICVQLIDAGAKRLTLVSLTESGLYKILRRLNALASSCEIIGVLGSAGDYELMLQYMEGVDLVIHAGAHKHVPLCENNACISIENNSIGTARLADAARACGVPTFVLISTDKAVKPESIMGASKRLAEMLIDDLRPDNDTTFITVRFGNVLDSDGSVFPLWRAQIAAGGPLTLTDPNCERYFMSIPDAVGLVLGCAELNQAGTYVFDMGAPQKLGDIAARMITESGQNVPIKVTGLRPGEKLTEDLYSGGELERTPRKGILRVVEPPTELDNDLFWELMLAVDHRAEKQARELLWELVGA
jgi:FlaA1/EpsC-like NDP-sugar epimerase